MLAFTELGLRVSGLKSGEDSGEVTGERRESL